MFRIFVALVFAASVGCSQHNPAVCCNTPTQCTSFGLDGVIGCDTGKVCDPTGACISPQCATSAECADPSAYCSSAGLCAMTCVADTECPGGGQAANQLHCVGGACVECGQASDCPTSAPICADTMCRACKVDGECPSQACASDGSCVGAADIAYVEPSGSDTADCAQSTPCSLVHGLSIGRSYTVLAAGTYQNAQGITITGTRWVIGTGAQKPTITRTTAGPIIDVGLGSDLHLSNVQVSGATVTNATSFDGVGINCVNDQTSRKLELTDVIVTGNAGDGVDGSSCAVSAKRSAFTNNGGQTPNQGSGLYVKDHLATIDQCDFSRNTSDGLTFDGTVLTVSNSFFYNNFANGLLVSTGDPGGQIQFSTIVGNGKFGLSIGQPSNDSFELSNNLIGNNPSGSVQCAFGTCPLTGSIVLGADVSSAHFKNATTDLHIMAGSVAIDAATNATLDHDFDGDVRPLGNGRDVGADEAQ